MKDDNWTKLGHSTAVDIQITNRKQAVVNEQSNRDSNKDIVSQLVNYKS